MLLIIDIISTIIEDFLLSYSCITFFSVEKYRKMKIIILCIICMSETIIFNNFLISNTLCIIILLSTLSLYLIIEFKKVRFMYFFIPLILLVGILLANSISVVIISQLYSVHITELSAYSFQFIIAIILSRIFIVVFCFFVLRLKSTVGNLRDLKKYWIYIPFSLVILLMLATLMESLIYRNISIQLIYKLLFELIVLLLCSILVFYLIHKQEQENIRNAKKMAEISFQNKQSYLIKKMMNEICNDKHMMTYTLMKLKSEFRSCSRNEYEYLLVQETNRYLKYRFISNTNNYFFDYEMTNYLQQLQRKDYNIKVLFTIKEYDEILSDEIVVNYIICCLQEMVSFHRGLKEYQINLDKKDGYLLFRVIIQRIENSDKEYCTFDENNRLRKSSKNNVCNSIEYSFLFI